MNTFEDLIALTGSTERFDCCETCNQIVGWIECPTGGWWAHEIHPEDDHDAVVVG